MDFLHKAQQLLFANSAGQHSTDLSSKPTRRSASKKRAPSFRSRYSLGSVLGKGTYSVVKKGFNLQNKDKVAIKCIDEQALTEKDAQALQREVKILRKLRHKHIISFKDFFYDSSEKMFFIVTEFCAGGEMFDAVVTKTCYPEYKVRQIIFALSDAVKHLHDRNITHRDLKPENILLKTDHTNGDFPVSALKIADFGFAFQCKDGNKENRLQTVCGSPIYVAPEILHHHSRGTESQGYFQKQVDVWSLGIIIYVLLCGYPPFMSSNNAGSNGENEKLFEKIKSGKFEFDEKYWKKMSLGVKGLIKKMLNTKPGSRLTINEVLADPWFDIERGRRVSEGISAIRVQRTRRVQAKVIGTGSKDRWSNLKTAVNKLRFISISSSTTTTSSTSTAASSERSQS